MTDLDDLALYTNPGRDRDGAAAMLSQARLKQNPIDDIQVRHLLAIGYRAGRKVTEADQRFDRTDHQFGQWELVCLGAVLGALLSGLLFWVLG